MKTYTFYDESYTERPACDCCEGSWVELYNSNDTDSRLGSAFCIEDCYTQSIITELGRYNISDEYEESLWNMSIEDLKNEASKLGIVVEIVS